jgi:hypothetical protein
MGFEILGPYTEAEMDNGNDWISAIKVFSYDPINAPRV